jgi:hypothetical protein
MCAAKCRSNRHMQSFIIYSSWTTTLHPTSSFVYELHVFNLQPKNRPTKSPTTHNEKKPQSNQTNHVYLVMMFAQCSTAVFCAVLFHCKVGENTMSMHSCSLSAVFQPRIVWIPASQHGVALEQSVVLVVAWISDLKILSSRKNLLPMDRH